MTSGSGGAPCFACTWSRASGCQTALSAAEGALALARLVVPLPPLIALRILQPRCAIVFGGFIADAPALLVHVHQRQHCLVAVLVRFAPARAILLVPLVVCGFLSGIAHIPLRTIGLVPARPANTCTNVLQKYVICFLRRQQV